MERAPSPLITDMRDARGRISVLSCGRWFRNRSGGDEQRVHKEREEIEGGGGGDQFDDLLFVVHMLQLGEKVFVQLTRGMMQAVGAAQAQLLGFGEGTILKVSFGSLDLLVAGALLFRRNRMSAHGIAGT